MKDFGYSVFVVEMELCVLGWAGLARNFLDGAVDGDSFVLSWRVVSVLQPVCGVILVVGSEVPESVPHRVEGSTIQYTGESGVFLDDICHSNRDLICNHTNRPTEVVREFGRKKLKTVVRFRLSQCCPLNSNNAGRSQSCRVA